MRNARLLHYSHCVSDLARSKRFYTEVLGFDVVAELDFDDADTARVMGVPGARFTGVFMHRDRHAHRADPVHPTRRPTGRRGAGRRTRSATRTSASTSPTSTRRWPSCGRRAWRSTTTAARRWSTGIECCVVRDPDGFPIEIVQTPTLTLLPYESA
ncbi:MAG: VOC family protein [Candidatus Binatia bacterium]